MALRGFKWAALWAILCSTAAIAGPTGGPLNANGNPRENKPAIITAASCNREKWISCQSKPGEPQKQGAAQVNIFSLRKVVSTYNGPLVRLFRASDSAILDVYPQTRQTGSFISQGLVAGWIGASSASVLIWYDQSGNGNNAVAPFIDVTPSVSLQPALTLNCLNGKPCITFNGSNALEANSPVNGNTAQFVLALTAPANHFSNPFLNWVFCCGQSQLQAWVSDQYSATNTGAFNERVYQQDGVFSSVAGVFNSASMDVYTNRLRLGTQTATTSAVNYPYRANMSLGFQTFAAYFTGQVAELIVGSTPVSQSQILAMQSDQMSAWGVQPFSSFSPYSSTLNRSTSAANSPPWYGVNQGGIGFGTAYDSLPDSRLQSYYAQRGFNITRFPVAWEQLQQGLCTGNTALNAAELALLDTAISNITASGMDVVIDLHNYGGYNYTYNGRTCASPPDNGHIDQATTRGYFVNFWSQIATRYKTNPKVKFDLMNEPVNVSAANLGVAAQLAITAIRAAGATQPIFVEGGGDYAACASFSTNAGPVFKTFTDSANNLVAECHAYFDSNNSGTSDVGSAGTALGRLQSAGTYATANGIKLFLGEFGVGFTPSMYAEDKIALDLMAASPSTWVGWTAWGGGPNWPEGYIYLFEPHYSSPIVDRPQMWILNTYATGHVWPAGKFP
jgi:endoglucanase